MTPKPFPRASPSVFTSPTSGSQPSQASSSAFNEGQSKVAVKTEGATSQDGNSAVSTNTDKFKWFIFRGVLFLVKVWDG